jgi:hypothetical protein
MRVVSSVSRMEFNRPWVWTAKSAEFFFSTRSSLQSSSSNRSSAAPSSTSYQNRKDRRRQSQLSHTRLRLFEHAIRAPIDVLEQASTRCF